MKTVSILLDTIEKVKNFVNTVAPLDGDIDLVSSRYLVDAKSIMGIFSLDITKPLTLQIHDPETAERLLPLIQDLLV